MAKLNESVVDLFLVYQFIKRLVLPFKEWQAYKLGIIDDKGKVLKKRSTLKTSQEKNAWGYFDILATNLKKLLAKIPGGDTRLASYAAAGLLLREAKELSEMSEEEIEDKVKELLKDLIKEDPANVAGSGHVAGLGVGPQGEPGIKKLLLLRRKKRKNA